MWLIDWLIGDLRFMWLIEFSSLFSNILTFQNLWWWFVIEPWMILIDWLLGILGFMWLINWLLVIEWIMWLINWLLVIEWIMWLIDWLLSNLYDVCDWLIDIW